MHFDSKIINELDEVEGISMIKERVAVSVSVPEDDEREDVLLGVVIAESSKGIDQIQESSNLLEFYYVIENIIAVCVDTTASNTGGKNGAIQLLSEFVLRRKIMWLLCRKHVYERHITHFIESDTGKTKGPSKEMYAK